MANIGDEIIDGSVRWIVRDTKSAATTVSSGLMSAADKIKLNGYPSKTTGNSKYLREDGTWQDVYTLKPATITTLGGVIVGNNLTVDKNGKIGLSLSGNANQVLKGDGTWDTPPDTDTQYTLQQASATTLGGVKIQSGTGVTVGSGGVISLTAASKFEIGGIRFPGGEGSVLSAEGTWVENQVTVPENVVNNILTSKKVYSLFKNQVDENTTTQLAKDNLFLAGDGSWKPFIVNPPKQWGVIVYDGEDHVPDFSAMDTDEYAVATLSASSTEASIQSYINDYLKTSVVNEDNGKKGRKGLIIRDGALHAKNAGVYLLQVSPRNNYVWSNKVSGWRGLTQYGRSYVGTQLPIVCHWTIRKAPNTISLSAKRAEAEFGDEVKIEYSTDSDDSLTIKVPNDSLNPYYDPTFKEWGVEVNNNQASIDSAETELTLAQKTKMPFLSKNGYFDLQVTNDDIDTSQKILKYTMLRRINWASKNKYHKKIRKQINYPQFTVTSAKTENYYSKSAVLKFINKRVSSTLDYWEIEEDYSELELTNTKPRVIRLKYESDAKPTITVKQKGLLEVKLLEEIVNDVIKAKTTDGKDFDDILLKNNLTGEGAEPESIELPYTTAYALKKAYTDTATIQSATAYLTDNTLVGDTAIFKNTNPDPELATDYNGVRMDEVLYPYLVCMSIDGTSRKWWFYLESDYEFIASRRVKYWNNKDNDKTKWKVDYKEVLFKHYRSLTLVIIPKGSSGSTTVTIKSPSRDNFYNLKDTLTMKITISPSAATPLTGTADGYPIVLTGSTTSANLTAAISRFASGTAANYYKVGDYIPFKFTKSMQLDTKDDNDQPRTIPTDTIYKAVLIGINHGNPSDEHVGTSGSDMNAGHFMIGKAVDNVQICFYGKYMNTTNTNSGGWANTTLKTWLNDEEEGFISALPDQLKNSIRAYTKTSATSINNTVGQTTDKIWIMSKGEMFSNSATNHVVDEELKHTIQYQYFLNGNSRFFYDYEDNSTGRSCWFRSMREIGGSQFVRVRAEEEGQGEETIFAQAAKAALGIVPCFVL